MYKSTLRRVGCILFLATLVAGSALAQYQGRQDCQSCCTAAYSAGQQQVQTAYRNCSQQAQTDLNYCKQWAYADYQFCVSDCPSNNAGSCLAQCQQGETNQLAYCQSGYNDEMDGCSQAAADAGNACDSSYAACTQPC